MMKECGRDPIGQILTDRSAAKGIVHRQGCGKVTHFSCRQLRFHGISRGRKSGMPKCCQGKEPCRWSDAPLEQRRRKQAANCFTKEGCECTNPKLSSVRVHHSSRVRDCRESKQEQRRDHLVHTSETHAAGLRRFFFFSHPEEPHQLLRSWEVLRLFSAFFRIHS